MFCVRMCVSCSLVSDSLWPHGLPGSPVHGILQARTLEWVTIPFSRGSSWLRDQTWVSCIADRFFTTVPPGKPRSWVDKWKCQQYRLVFLLLLFWVFHHWTWATAKGQLLLDAIRSSVSTCSDSEMTEKEVTCGNISALPEASGLGFLLPDEYQWVILFFLHPHHSPPLNS